MKKTKNKSIVTVPKLLFCASMLVVLVGILLLYCGSSRTAVTLEKPDETDALQGFTLRGAVGDASYCENFTLKDGKITSKSTPKSVYPFGSNARLWASTSWHPTAEAFAAMGKTLKKTDAADIWESTCNDFALMLTVNTGNDKMARIHTGAVLHTAAPVTMQTASRVSAWGKEELTGYYSAYQNETLRDVRCGITEIDDITYVYCDAASGLAPTLYRVDAETDAQNDLPKNGNIKGIPMVLPTEEYGKLSTVHAFSNNSRIAGITGVDDILCVAMLENDTVTLYLMDKGGKITDIYPTGVNAPITDTESQQLVPYVQFAQQQNAHEVCFSTQTFSAASAVMSTFTYSGLRVENGKVTSICQTKPISAASMENADTAMMELQMLALSMRADGKALLVANPHTRYDGTKQGSTGVGTYLQDGVTLNIYENNSDTPLFSNRLQCNMQDDTTAARLNLLPRQGYQRTGQREFAFDTARLAQTKRFEF